MARPSYTIKLAWAGEHMKALRAEIQWWIRSDPYRTTSEVDPKTGETLYIEPFGDPPAKLSLMVGDVINNLRSTLDHLALALVEANIGEPPPPEVEIKSQFPICDTKPKFQAARKRHQIICVNPKAQARIQGLQPYRRWDAPQTHPLHLLRELSDFDKHRRLPLVAIWVQPHGASFPMNVHIEHIELHGPVLPLDKKAPLVTVKDAVDLKTGAEVDVQAEFSLRIAFSEAAPPVVARLDVVEVLAEIGDYITGTVVPKLEPFL